MPEGPAPAPLGTGGLCATAFSDAGSWRLGAAAAAALPFCGGLGSAPVIAATSLFCDDSVFCDDSSFLRKNEVILFAGGMGYAGGGRARERLSLIHISEPTRPY